MKNCRNIRQRLANLSGKTVKDFDFSKIAECVADELRKAEEEDKEKEQYNASSVSERFLSALKKTCGEVNDPKDQDINGKLPVISVFDAYQIVKMARDEYPRDVGISVLCSHLGKKWKRKKDANLLTSDFLRLKESYIRQYPKSKASSILEIVADNGYMSLDIGQLTAIAENIKSQEDYDYYIRQNCLASNSPQNKKARKFILALLNSEEE
jgi:hypothetical protein